MSWQETLLAKRNLYGITVLLALAIIVAFTAYRRYQQSPAGRLAARLDSVMYGKRDSTLLDQPCGKHLFYIEQVKDSLEVVGKDDDDIDVIRRIARVYTEALSCDTTLDLHWYYAIQNLIQLRDYSEALLCCRLRPRDMVADGTVMVALLEVSGDTSEARKVLSKSYEWARGLTEHGLDDQSLMKINYVTSIVLKGEKRYGLEGVRDPALPKLIDHIVNLAQENLDYTDAKTDSLRIQLYGISVTKMDSLLLEK